MKNRIKQRVNRKLKEQEARLDKESFSEKRLFRRC